MRLAMVVNKFEVEAYTDGHPMWTTIKHNGEELTCIHHSEIRDLIYALQRLQSQIKQALPTDYKHEVD